MKNMRAISVVSSLVILAAIIIQGLLPSAGFADCPACSSKLDCIEWHTTVVAWSKDRTTGEFTWIGRSYYEANDNGTPSVQINNAFINFYTRNTWPVFQAPSIPNSTPVMYFDTEGTPDCAPDPAANQGINVDGSVVGPGAGLTPTRRGQVLCTHGS